MLVAQVLLLAMQIKRDEKGRLLRMWTVGAISPFERVGSWCAQKVRGTWNGYFALRGAAKENEELRRELPSSGAHACRPRDCGERGHGESHHLY